MSEIDTKQLETLIDQGDHEGAQKLIEQELQKPLSDEEAGEYYTQLMRIYMRYMTELNDELASILEESQQLMRNIDQREQRGLRELSATDDASE